MVKAFDYAAYKTAFRARALELGIDPMVGRGAPVYEDSGDSARPVPRDWWRSGSCRAELREFLTDAGERPTEAAAIRAVLHGGDVPPIVVDAERVWTPVSVVQDVLREMRGNRPAAKLPPHQRWAKSTYGGGPVDAVWDRVRV